MQRMLLGSSRIPKKDLYSLSKKQGNLRFLWVFQDELLKKTFIKGINWNRVQLF